MSEYAEGGIFEASTAEFEELMGKRKLVPVVPPDNRRYLAPFARAVAEACEDEEAVETALKELRL